MARHHSHFLCFWPAAKCNWRPLLYAVRMHTGRETSAQKKLGSHKNVLLKLFFAHVFHICVPNTNESWLNVAQKKLLVHTGWKKLEGTASLTQGILCSIYKILKTFLLDWALIGNASEVIILNGSYIKSLDRENYKTKCPESDLRQLSQFLSAIDR